MDKEAIVIVLNLQDLDDLLDMARQSKQYREGYAWAAVAVNKVLRERTNVIIRANEKA